MAVSMDFFFSLPFAFIKMSIQLPLLVMLADMSRKMFISANKTPSRLTKMILSK